MTEDTAGSVDAVAATVKEFILQEFLPGTSASELTATTPLVTGGILDSLATVRLVTFLEERFGIEIQPHETGVDYMDSVHDIAQLVVSKSSPRP
jgi:acyl carrier protein